MEERGERSSPVSLIAEQSFKNIFCAFLILSRHTCFAVSVRNVKPKFARSYVKWHKILRYKKNNLHNHENDRTIRMPKKQSKNARIEKPNSTLFLYRSIIDFIAFEAHSLPFSKYTGGYGG